MFKEQDTLYPLFKLVAQDFISEYCEEFVGDIPDDEEPPVCDREWVDFNPELHEF